VFERGDKRRVDYAAMRTTKTFHRRAPLGWLVIALAPAIAFVIVLAYREYRYERLRRFCGGLRVGQLRESVATEALSRGLVYSTGARHEDFVVFQSVWPGLGWCIVEHDGKKVYRTKVKFE
jgi:hypothetical protein